HGAQYEWLRLARIASRRQYDGRVADGSAAPTPVVARRVALPDLSPEHLPRDADLRSDRRRQRQRHVRDWVDGREMEQLRAQSRVCGVDGGRLRSNPPGMALT